MKVKMKICIKCNTLLSNSSKVCTRCGSKEIEKGFYTDELNKPLEFNKQLYKPNRDITNIYCPTCSAPVTIENRYGECCFCGDEISVTNYIEDYIKSKTEIAGLRNPRHPLESTSSPP